MQHYILIPRPDITTAPDIALHAFVECRTNKDGTQNMVLGHIVTGDVESLKFPLPSSADTFGIRRDNLWRTTCFEAFFNPVGYTDYVEINVAPQGDWALYEFSSYRNGMSDKTVSSSPAVIITYTDCILKVVTQLPLTACHHEGISIKEGLRVGLAAVTEDKSGHVTYWALKHCTDELDFHHTDSFIAHIKT